MSDSSVPLSSCALVTMVPVLLVSTLAARRCGLSGEASRGQQGRLTQIGKLLGSASSLT